MNVNSNRPSENQDDLDLFLLLQKATLFLKANRVTLITATIIGIGGALILGKLKHPVYTTRMVVESRFISSPEQIEISKDWNMKLAAGRYDLLAQEFDCPVDLVKKLGGITIEMLPSPGKNVSCSSIIFALGDTVSASGLQKAIEAGFGNNTFIQPRLAFRKASLQQRIAVAEAEMRKLDSAKDTRSMKRENAPDYPEASSVAMDKVYIGEKLAGLTEDLLLARPINVVQGPGLPVKGGTKLPILLIVGAVAGFLAGYFISLFKSVIRTLPKRNVT